MKKSDRTPIRSRDLTFIPFDSHDEWLTIRRNYIGGSDAGAVVGMNEWSSPLSVWADKTGSAPAFSGNVSTRVGAYLEDLVAKLFMEETGKTVQRLKFTIVNPAYPFACANIDREVVGEDALLEIKTTGSIGVIQKFRNGEFPDQWYAQVTHYMAVTGVKKAYLAALESNRELHIFELDRDEDEIKALMDAERYFWENYVKTMTPPPADGHRATTETVGKMYPDDGGDDVDLTDIAEDFAQRKRLKESRNAIDSQIETIDNRIKLRMGEASKGTAGLFSASWKVQTRNSFDAEALKADYPEIDLSKYTRSTQSRVFRVTEQKPKKS